MNTTQTATMTTDTAIALATFVHRQFNAGSIGLLDGLHQVEDLAAQSGMDFKTLDHAAAERARA